ncbi:aldehyde dehydrogenase family protein [Geodermatophilus sp. SYSU D00079]
MAARLEAGTVWVDAHGGVHSTAPLGGVEESGYGLESGVTGLASVAVPQVVDG